MLKYESLCSSSEACGGLCLGLELGVAVESVWALLPGMDEGLGGGVYLQASAFLVSTASPVGELPAPVLNKSRAIWLVGGLLITRN